jgi:hypothetical protein
VTGGSSQAITYGFDGHGNQATSIQQTPNGIAPTWTGTLR